MKNSLSKLYLYAVSTASLIVGVAAQSVAFLIVARYLGKTNYGELSTLTALTAVCSSWVQYGTVELMRRRVAIDPRQYNKVMGHCLIILFMLGSIATVVISAILTYFVHLGHGWFADYGVVLLFAICTLMLYPWMVLVEQIFLAHNLYSRANLTNAGFGAWRVAVAAIGCIGFGVHTVSEWAIWNFGAYASASVAGALAVAKFGRPELRIMRDEIAIGATFGVSGFLYNLRGNIDIVSLSAVVPPEVVGSYGLARKVISVALVTGASLDRLIYSTLVRTSRQGWHKAAASAVKFAAYALVIASVTAIALWVVAPVLIPTLFGASYKDAVPLVRLLCGIIVVIALQNLAFDVLNSGNLHKLQVAVSTIFVSIGAATLAALTHAYAVPGTIFGVYIMEVLLMVALWGALGGFSQLRKLPALSFLIGAAASHPSGGPPAS